MVYKLLGIFFFFFLNGQISDDFEFFGGYLNFLGHLEEQNILIFFFIIFIYKPIKKFGRRYVWINFVPIMNQTRLVLVFSTVPVTRP